VGDHHSHRRNVVGGVRPRYFRGGGYLSGIAWLWALSLVLACAIGTCALVAVGIAVRWPNVPRSALGLVATTPLSRVQGDARRARLAFACGASAAMLLVLAAVVAIVPGVVSWSDVRFANAIAVWDLQPLRGGASALQDTGLVLVIAICAIAIGYRCVVYSVVYVGALAVTFAAGFLTEVLVGRERPLGVLLTGRPTFPSIAVAQLVVVAGLVPVGLASLRGRRRLAIGAGFLLAGATLAVGLVEVNQRERWPTDVLGGALLGAAVVLGAWWVLAHGTWHRLCPHAAGRRDASKGLLTLSDEWSRGLQRAAAAWSVLVAFTFVAFALRWGIPQDPDGAIVGTDVAQAVQIGLVVLVLLGGSLALRSPASGATVIAIAGVGLGVMSATENPPVVAIVITVATLLPAFLLWVSWQASASARRVWLVALVATALLTAGFFGAANVYAQYFGPTHPRSELALLPVEGVEWAWSGALTPTGGTVVARLDYGTHRAHLRVAPVGGGVSVRSPTVEVPDDRIVRLRVDGLAPGSAYRWTVVADGSPDHSRGTGRFRTPAESAQSFTVVVGACSRTGSDGQVWDAMRAVDPDLVVVAGDLHYQNIEDDDVDAFLDAYDRVLTQPAPAALFRAAPVAYVWDDHDYGPNDADRTSPSRHAARTAYEKSVPHAALGPSGPPAQAFSVGRVRFILTDERSHRSADTMLGRRQLEWFLDELVTASRTHSLVVWVNSVPWIGKAGTGDAWPAYAAERRRIADTIDAARIDNLVMLAGDAHMVAIDDGTNSGYARGGGGAFALLHAGALDRPGNVKGGPYSEGAHPGGGQFGVLRVRDKGSSVKVELEGRNWEGDTFMRYSFTVPRDLSS
jgi:hypothetical protein